jgi:Tfp pilus assembly protein PilX
MSRSLPASPTDPRRRQESGAIAIIVVFLLLSIGTVAAMSLGHSALREALITGNESTGRKAYEMADSGMDYFITWINGNYSTAPPAAAQALLAKQAALLDILDQGTSNADGTVKVTLLASATGGDMTPANTGYLQTSTSVKPSFDLEMWSLGYQAFTPVGNKGAPKYGYLVRSTGRASIGNTGQSFISIHEGFCY